MINAQITIAKIQRTYYDQLLNGTKKYELRTQPFTTNKDDTSLVLFIDPDTHEPYGLIQFTNAGTLSHDFHTAKTSHTQLIQHIANCTPKIANELAQYQTLHIYTNPKLIATPHSGLNTIVQTIIKQQN